MEPPANPTMSAVPAPMICSRPKLRLRFENDHWFATASKISIVFPFPLLPPNRAYREPTVALPILHQGLRPGVVFLYVQLGGDALQRRDVKRKTRIKKRDPPKTKTKNNEDARASKIAWACQRRG